MSLLTLAQTIDQPHLHFELHINGRPVDPMKANIPLSRSVSEKQKAMFSETVAKQTRLPDKPKKITKIAVN